MSLVLDASAALAWLYPEESTDAVSSVFDLLLRSGATVPALWWIEIANSLTLSIRRSRITKFERNTALESLAEMDIKTDSESGSQVLPPVMVLADRHRLTVYDAVYLELAQRLSLPLATLDQDLRRAAKKEAVPLLGL